MIIHAILHYTTWSPFFEDVKGDEWQHLRIHDNTIEFETIDEIQARRAIKKNGLVLAEQNEYGEVYDTPSGAFRSHYKGRGEEVAKRIRERMGEPEVVETKQIERLADIEHSNMTEIGRVKSYIRDAAVREAVDIEKLMPIENVWKWTKIMADYMRQAPDGTAVRFPNERVREFYNKQCRIAGDEHSIIKIIEDKGRLIAFKLPR